MRVASLACAALLAGCSALSPANFFHRREGGVIAQPHPPPPGMNQPYPNLATVPPNPPPPDMAALEHISNGLIADRANARHLAEAAPLADPSSPSASPDLFGVGSASPPAPPGPATASATLPAATAAPAAAAPQAASPPLAATAPSGRQAMAPSVQKAPVGEVQSAVLPAAPPAAAPPVMSATPPAPPPEVAKTPVRPPAAAQPSAPAVVATARPPVAPPRPSVPTPIPPATIPPAAAPAPANPANTVEVDFAPASSSIPSASLPALRALAAKRGNHVIEALGRGDAASSDPTAQEQAVTLGFARAQAIAAALTASGVPRGAIQVMSLAAGRGGMAQLVE